MSQKTRDVLLLFIGWVIITQIVVSLWFHNQIGIWGSLIQLFAWCYFVGLQMERKE